MNSRYDSQFCLLSDCTVLYPNVVCQYSVTGTAAVSTVWMCSAAAVHTNIKSGCLQFHSLCCYTHPLWTQPAVNHGMENTNAVKKKQKKKTKCLSFEAELASVSLYKRSLIKFIFTGMWTNSVFYCRLEHEQTPPCLCLPSAKYLSEKACVLFFEHYMDEDNSGHKGGHFQRYCSTCVVHSRHKTCIELCFLHSWNNEITETELTAKSSNLCVRWLNSWPWCLTSL